jgi:2-methylcitrate dehydratase PrpD
MRDSISRALGVFAQHLSAGALPHDVRRMLPSLVRDQLACQVVGSGIAHNALVREYALEESPAGVCTVVRGERCARAEWAALANATAGHGFEMDDTHAQALAHPGCVIVPAVLALGEQLGAHGHDVEAALALGFEIAVRVGLAVQPEMLHGRGFHETCVMGVFGAAAAAGRLMHFDGERYVAAFGIAGSHASGTIEYGRSGGEVKRLHAGLGAMGGLRAARLAALGLTGPARIFEGTKGLLQALTPAPRADALLAGLGREWHLTGLCAKEFCAAATIHGPVKALRAIMHEHRVAPADIARIVVGVDAFSAGHLGTLGPRPVDFAGAQFSLHYSLAMSAVLGGAGPREYQHAAAENFADREILRLAESVTVEVDDEAARAFPLRFAGVVRVQCVDGSTHAARAEATPYWDFAFVERRFREVLTDAYGADVADAIGRGIDALGDDRPLRGVIAPLATAQRVASTMT